MAEEKSYKTIQNQLEGGSILQSYGSKYLVSVCPTPSIHKVRWSIVELNTGGKVFSNFFMSMEQMRQLCDEIEKGIASKKLAADKDSQYPGAYKYVTGENGSKKLNIGGGLKGIRIQIQENKDGSWDNKMSVIPIADFVQMKFLFFLVMGLTYFRDNSYYSSLYDSFWKGEAQRANLHQKSYNEKDDSEYVEEKNEAPSSISQNEETPIVAPKPIVAEPKEEKTIEEKIATDFVEITQMKLKVANGLKLMDNGNFRLTGLDEQGRSIFAWFDTKLSDNRAIWEKFTPIGGRVGAMVTLTGTLKEKDGRFHLLAKSIAM